MTQQKDDTIIRIVLEIINENDFDGIEEEIAILFKFNKLRPSQIN